MGGVKMVIFQTSVGESVIRLGLSTITDRPQAPDS